MMIDSMSQEPANGNVQVIINNENTNTNTNVVKVKNSVKESHLRPGLLCFFGICFPELCCLQCLMDYKSRDKTNRCLSCVNCCCGILLTFIYFWIIYTAAVSLFLSVVLVNDDMCTKTCKLPNIKDEFVLNEDICSLCLWFLCKFNTGELYDFFIIFYYFFFLY